MNIYFSFGEGWYLVLGTLVCVWLLIIIYRKGYRNRKEIKQQIIVSMIGIGLAFGMEYMAVSKGIWHYFPGDWPIILWPFYFLVGIAGYQLVKLAQEHIR